MTISSVNKFRTSQQAEEDLRILHKKTNLPFNLLCRLAWSRSVQIKDSLSSGTPDTTGRELNRYSVTGDYDDLIKAVTTQFAGRRLTDEEFFSQQLKAHVDRGLQVLARDLERAGSLDAFWSLLLENIPRTPSAVLPRPAGTPVSPVALVVGEEIGTGEPVVCAINQATNPHMAIVGIPGSGKTQFVLKLLADIRRDHPSVNFIVLDYAKGDVANNSAFVEATGARVITLPDRPLPIDPFALDDYGPSAVRFAAEEKVESLHSYQALGAVQKGLLARAIEAAYQERASEDDPSPDFETVYRRLLMIYEEEDRSEDTLTEVLRKLTAFHLFPSRSDDIPRLDTLADQTLIVDLHKLPALRELVAFCLIEKLYRELRVNLDSPVDESTHARELRTVLVIDEAHNYLPRNNIFLEKLIREMRSKGLAVILLSQSPDDFEQKHFDYTELLEFVFVLKCTTTKAQHIQKLIRCKSETAKSLAPKLANLPYPEGYTQHRTKSSGDYTHLSVSQFHIAYKER